MSLPAPLFAQIFPMPQSMVSPVALERQRLEKAARAMDVFCDDLAEMCDRPERDDLTQEIYLAAQQAGESLDGDVEIPKWFHEAEKVVRRLVRKIEWQNPESLALDKNEADVVVCLERADEFFAPFVPTDELRVQLALCLYDFAFVRIDEFDEKVEEPVVALVAREEPGEIARVERDSKLMLAKTVRWGATLLAGIGLFTTGAVWLIPMIFVAWLASWMLIDKKAIEQPALPAAEGPTKQQVIEDFVRTKKPEELQNLWDSAPDVGTLFEGPSKKTPSSTNTRVRGIFMYYDEPDDR